MQPQPLSFLDRLKCCDYCGRRAVDPILRLADFDQAELLCEMHVVELETVFTPQAAVAQASRVIELHQRAARKAA